MSILVKGMEMPHDCDSCKMSNVLDCTLWKPMDIGERHPECPLVEMQTPHGRLIDEAIVLEMIRKSMGIKDLSCLYNAKTSIVNEIYHAPTVIEAEDE